MRWTPIAPPFGVGMGYVLRAGLTMYDLMSGTLSIRRHRKLPAGRVSKMMPCLRTEGLTNAFLYYDGQTDDTRLTLTVVRTAAEQTFDRADVREITAAGHDNVTVSGETRICWIIVDPPSSR